MHTKQDEILNIIAKLMNEENIEECTKLRQNYNALNNLVEEKLPKVLDEGLYTNNAGIIDKINKIVKEKEILTLIDGLATKSVIAIWGEASSIDVSLKSVDNIELKIEHNKNLPLLIIPAQKDVEEKIFALTYANKKIEISSREYELINREVYKENIDICKLIQGFIYYYPGQYLNQVYLILPEYLNTYNNLYRSLSKIINEQLIICEDESKYKIILHKTLNCEIYLFTSKQEIMDLEHCGRKIILCSRNYIFNLLIYNNNPSINYHISVRVQEVLLDIQLYYSKYYKLLKERLEELNKDSVKLEDEKLKGIVKDYKEKIKNELKELKKAQKSYAEISDDILKLCNEFELNISNILMQKADENVLADQYVQTLTNVFFKHIYAEDYQAADDDIVKLGRVNYKYCSLLKLLFLYNKGVDISTEVLSPSINNLISNSHNIPEVAKVQIALSEQFKLNEDEIKKLTEVAYPIETGEEYFYLAKRLVDEGNIAGAKQALFSSLEKDFKQAGVELVKLAKKYPKSGISIEELAERLVSDANYHVGKENIDTKYAKGMVHLKIAASKNHKGAIKIIADMLFKKCRTIHANQVHYEKSKNMISNTIRLYEILERNKSFYNRIINHLLNTSNQMQTTEYNSNESYDDNLYRLRIGLMYIKLRDYSRAYSYLKNIDDNEAQYECGKIYHYGYGVPKDLNTAKKHYEKIKGNFQDSQKLYRSVCDELNNKEKEKRQNNTYSKSKSYSSTSTYSESSSGCFITTAACMALNKGKYCDELNILRKFRDEHIKSDGVDGDELVDEYYRIGPLIIKEIDNGENPEDVYKNLWEIYIYPSYDMINKKDYIAAKKIYIDMVKSLCEKYNIQVKDSIRNTYAIKVNS